MGKTRRVAKIGEKDAVAVEAIKSILWNPRKEYIDFSEEKLNFFSKFAATLTQTAIFDVKMGRTRR